MAVMGSKFNTSDEHVRTFLEEIRRRGLMFLEGDTNIVAWTGNLDTRNFVLAPLSALVDKQFL